MKKKTPEPGMALALENALAICASAFRLGVGFWNLRVRRAFKEAQDAESIIATRKQLRNCFGENKLQTPTPLGIQIHNRR